MFRITVVNESYEVDGDHKDWQLLWGDEAFAALEAKDPDTGRRQYGYATTGQPILREVEVLNMRVDSLDLPFVINAILQAAQADGKLTAEEAT